MSKSRIEWTDATWNPVTGCTKVSQGCKHCYAEREWPRLTRLVPAYAGREFADVRCHTDRLDHPLRWNKPRRVFVNSMSDLFHEDVPDEFIDRVFAVMALCPQHTFQVLTKRARRMRKYISQFRQDGRYVVSTARNQIGTDHRDGNKLLLLDNHATWPLPNVWLGVSVEDQATAEERIPLLLDTPAAVRWISAEPLLGAVDLSRWIEPMLECSACGAQYDLSEKVTDEAGYHWGADKCAKCGQEGYMGTVWGYEAAMQGCQDSQERDEWDHGYKLHWVVVGGESGPKARPMHPDWVRSLRDQCASAGVPFLFKQWGEWASAKGVPGHLPIGHIFDDGYQMIRVGKKAAGRLLDGVLHNEYPDGDKS